MTNPFFKKRAYNITNLISSRWAEGTKNNYRRGWKRWLQFCSNCHESKPSPADPFFIAVCINEMVLDNCKYGALTNLQSGIRWGHVSMGLDNPMENLFVKTVLEGAKRTVGKPDKSNRKDPINTNMAKQIVQKLSWAESLMDRRIIIFALLGFSGFLRISEAMVMQVKHIQFRKNCMQITIPKSKNDQHREGKTLLVAKTGSRFCPVQNLKDYLRITQLGNEGENFIICRLAKTREGHRALGRYHLSDTTIREQFMTKIAPICQGIEEGNYGPHSLRSGGATVASNAGVDERKIEKHGRWNAPRSKFAYIKDDEENRLTVSRALDL